MVSKLPSLGRRTGMNFDDSRLRNGLSKMTGEVMPSATKEGMTKVFIQLVDDVVNKRPKIPFRFGWLAGSISCFINKKLVYISEFGKAGAKAKKTIQGLPINKGEVRGEIVINVPYAGVMHEVQFSHYTTKGSGPKYLLTKMITFKNKYARILAEGIRKHAQSLMPVSRKSVKSKPGGR